MRRTMVAAFIMGLTTVGLADAALLSSTSTLETTGEILGTTAETTVETTLEASSDPALEADSETTVEVWIPPPGLLSDELIASLGGSGELDTTIASVDLSADLNIYSVPEPGIVFLLGIGIAALIAARRKK